MDKQELAFFTEQARKDLLSFCVFSDRFYSIEPHHEQINNALMEVLEGKTERLIISMPPRSGKSRIMQEFIAWVYGNYPKTDILYTGHSLSLLEGFSRNIMDRINSQEYKQVFDSKLSQGASSVKSWKIKNGGEFAIYGVGGGITGRGGNCILKGEKVHTNNGPIKIEDIIESIDSFQCLTYNHKNNGVEYKPIINWKKSKSSSVYKITTKGGNILNATGKHRVFVVGEGYKEVEVMKKGEQVIFYDNECGVQPLQKNISKTCLRNKEGNKNWLKEFLLFAGMYVKRQKMTQMQKMLKKSSRKALKNLGELQKTIKKVTRHTMWTMQQDFSSNNKIYKILLYGLQKQKSFGKNEMKNEFKLETLNELRRISKRILQEKKSYFRERQSYLYDLWLKSKIGNTSQRQKSVEQSRGKLDNSLQYMPSSSSQLKIDTISTIELISGEHEVYDLEIKDNNNFFASNILVHNCLIIDDPYSSRQDAESETVRRTVSNWYWSTFLSRKQDDKASQIIIMQRWREDDLVGEILEREGEKWKVLTIPALNDNDESFWPSRFSADYFKEIRDNNPIFFSSQYQQDPVNKDGGDFKQEYFQEYNIAPQELEVVTFIDPAISQKQEADNTAIVTIGLHRASNNIYVLDTDYGHFLPDEIIDKVFKKNIEFRPQRIGIEVVQYQKMLALEMRKQMNERNMWFTLDEINPRGEKNARIRTILQPRYSSNKIFHKKNGQLEQELLKFPNGKHDDIADALAGAVAMLDTYVLGSVQLPRMNSIYTPDGF